MSSMRPVPDKILKLVAQERIALSAHAAEGLAEDGFSLDDLINSIVDGHLVKKERDETGAAAYKYVVVGPSESGRSLYSCGKIVTLDDDQEYFVITAHEGQE